MNKYENFTVQEMEREAYGNDNQLAIALLKRIEELEQSLHLIKIEDEASSEYKEVEYMKKTLNMENNW